MRLAQRLALKYIRTRFSLLSSISKQKAAEKAFELFCTPQSRNKKKLPPVFEKAEKLEFVFEKNIVHGFRLNAGAEKKLLLLHGFESSVINFDKYVNPLIKKGYEILAFDAPAHGRSGGKKIEVMLYKNLIATIDKKFGPVHSFLAHSFGGLAVCLFLEDLPHDANTKLVLIAPATETKRAADNFFNFLKLDDKLRAPFDKIIKEKGGHAAEWYSIARAAYNIKARVLFLQDTEDELTPLADVTPIINAGHNHFQFIISEGLGHRKIYRDAKSVRAIIEFL
ncbi:MAG: alpha/beta hydrolase [Bacteroidota bacterium]